VTDKQSFTNTVENSLVEHKWPLISVMWVAALGLEYPLLATITRSSDSLVWSWTTTIYLCKCSYRSAKDSPERYSRGLFQLCMDSD